MAIDKKTKTFLGVIGVILGIFIFINNPWDFKSTPSIQSIAGLILLIIGLWVAYDANK